MKRPTDGSPGSDEPYATLDPTAIDELRSLAAGGDVTLLKDVLGTYLRDAASYAREIRTAIAESDARKLDRCAHTLKSTSATVGAMELAEICKELEQLGRRGLTSEAASKLDELDRRFSAALAAVTAELERS
ncbi:MAG: Hpt domain-containing protein [Planctomycetes bacterium]|nr:Hpt domain-containing protein [Planctomycetota bacterium]